MSAFRKMQQCSRSHSVAKIMTQAEYNEDFWRFASTCIPFRHFQCIGLNSKLTHFTERGGDPLQKASHLLAMATTFILETADSNIGSFLPCFSKALTTCASHYSSLNLHCPFPFILEVFNCLRFTELHFRWTQTDGRITIYTKKHSTIVTEQAPAHTPSYANQVSSLPKTSTVTWMVVHL